MDSSSGLHRFPCSTSLATLPLSTSYWRFELGGHFKKASELLKFGQRNRAWVPQEGEVQARSEWSDTEPTNTRASQEELVHDDNNDDDKSYY